MKLHFRSGVVIPAALAAFAFAAPAVLAQSAENKPVGADSRAAARELLQQGVLAFRGARFEEAIDDFSRAKQLDPSLLNASLYLATAYASLYIPGAPSEENTGYGKQAIQEFRAVLARDPDNLSAIDGIASILYNMAGTPFDPKMMMEAKAFQQKHIDISPRDSVPYYWVGVIDWAVAYGGNRELRQNWMKEKGVELANDELLPEAVRQQFEGQYANVVDEGIEKFKQAMALQPDYDDAMAYLNLLYRMKAEMEPTAGLRDGDLKAADDLVEEVKKIKNKKMGLPRSE